MDKNKNFYLLAKKTTDLRKFTVLPFWETLNDIALEQKLIDQLKDKSNIVIGISSPKQDFLAELLNEQYPQKKFYCLGAPVYTNPIYNTEWVIVTLGTMLFANPKRTILKIVSSINSFLKAIIFERHQLKTFSEYL